MAKNRRGDGKVRLTETAIISLTVIGFSRYFINHLSARDQTKGLSTDKECRACQVCCWAALCRAYSDEENCPAEIPDVFLIPGLTESGCFCGQECLGSGREVVKTLGGWEVITFGPRQYLRYRHREEVLLCFSSG